MLNQGKYAINGEIDFAMSTWCEYIRLCCWNASLMLCIMCMIFTAKRCDNIQLIATEIMLDRFLLHCFIHFGWHGVFAMFSHVFSLHVIFYWACYSVFRSAFKQYNQCIRTILLFHALFGSKYVWLCYSLFPIGFLIRHDK